MKPSFNNNKYAVPSYMSFSIPYVNHPAFKPLGSDQQWKLLALYEFNELYEQAFKNRKNALINNRCVSALQHIFSDLKKQTNNRREVLFLDELEEHSFRVLQDDLLAAKYKQRNTQKTLDKNLYPDFAKNLFIQEKISPNTLREILSITKDCWPQFRANVLQGKTKRHDLEYNTNEIVIAVVAALNKEFDAKKINHLVSQYMGRPYYVSGVSIELSVQEANWWKASYEVLLEMPKTLYFHLDESILHPKSIVYLCDVGESNGATSCVPQLFNDMPLTPLQNIVGRAVGNVGRNTESELGQYYHHIYHQTFGCPTFRSDFARLPNEMRFASHFGPDVIPHSALEQHMMEHEKKIIGEAGTCIVFDGGKLTHRGGMVTDGERMALQVIFGPRPDFFFKVKRKLKSLFHKIIS